jgi:hypothetical protein
MATGRIGLGFVAVGAAIGALIPVFMVVYPAAGVGRADASNPQVLLPVIAANPGLVVGPGIIELLGHALGAAAMVGLWMAWGRSSYLLTTATLAGVAWMAIDVVDNALTLQLAPGLATAFIGGDASAAGRYVTVSSLVDALRLAGHFAGGLWVVGVSAFSVRTPVMHPVIGWAGVAIGAVLAANPLLPVLLNVSFMTLPIWLIAFGVAVGRATLPVARFTPEPAASMP